jgi:hypothetical protein
VKIVSDRRGVSNSELHHNNNTFTWSGPSGVLAAPDNGPYARDTVVQVKTLMTG